MAFRTRKTIDEMTFALVAAWNAKQEASVASFFHADITQITSGQYQSKTVTNDTVTAANASDLATSITLVNQLKAVINRHFADTFAHNTAVSAQITTADAATLLTEVQTLANAIKTAYTTHLSASNVHFNNDATNTIAAANATDQSTANTLLNELKADFNAHLISAPLGNMIRLVS